MPVSITFPVVILSEIDDRSHVYQIMWAYDFPDRIFQRLLVNAVDNPLVRNAGRFSACSKSSCIVKSILGFFYTFSEQYPSILLET